METVQFRISCPQCGSVGFKPDNASPQDLADGHVTCASCGRVLTVADVQQLKAAIAASSGPQDAVSASVAQAVHSILK